MTFEVQCRAAANQEFSLTVFTFLAGIYEWDQFDASPNKNLDLADLNVF